MPEYPIHSIHANSVAVGASDTETITLMPTLPLSYIIVTVEANLVAANTSDIPETLLGQLLSVQFRHRGTQIWAASGLDLYRQARILTGFKLSLQAWAYTAASRRVATLIIPFGRRPYDPKEAFPAVQKGESELYISWDAATATYDTLRYTIESVQLPDAQPANFLRCTTMAYTPSATGDNDVALPRSSPILGLGVVQTLAEPANTNGTIETIKILANNQDTWYSLIHMLNARAMAAGWRDGDEDMAVHQHISDVAAAYTQFQATRGNQWLNSVIEKYGYLDFDPTDDGMWALQAQQFQDLTARINFNTAAAIRLLPVELWPITMIRKPGTPATAR